MKTVVKTSIKGKENIYVKESVDVIYNRLSDKHSFILLTSISHDGKEKKLGIKKLQLKCLSYGKFNRKNKTIAC